MFEKFILLFLFITGHQALNYYDFKSFSGVHSGNLLELGQRTLGTAYSITLTCTTAVGNSYIALNTGDNMISLT